MKVYLGIDWGGTYLKAGIVDAKNKIIKKISISSEKLKERDNFFYQLKNIINRFSSFTIKAIGIGAPGIIDIKKGFIYYLPNIPGWENYPLKEAVSDFLKIPVFVDNDANLFGLAELKLGKAKGKKIAIFITLGTGLGASFAIDGKIFRGRTSAAELGHVPFTSNGRKCSCGARGCIETFVGSNYLKKRYQQLKKVKEDIEVKDIFKRALRGDAQALIVWREFAKNLGKFLAGMINIFNPQIIVLGGGVSGAFSLFKPTLFSVIKEQTMWPHLEGLEIVRAKLKDSGILGAAILAKENVS